MTSAAAEPAADGDALGHRDVRTERRSARRLEHTRGAQREIVVFGNVVPAAGAGEEFGRQTPDDLPLLR